MKKTVVNDVVARAEENAKMAALAKIKIEAEEMYIHIESINNNEIIKGSIDITGFDQKIVRHNALSCTFAVSKQQLAKLKPINLVWKNEVLDTLLLHRGSVVVPQVFQEGLTKMVPVADTADCYDAILVEAVKALTAESIEHNIPAVMSDNFITNFGVSNKYDSIIVRKDGKICYRFSGFIEQSCIIGTREDGTTNLVPTRSSIGNARNKIIELRQKGEYIFELVQDGKKEYRPLV